MQPFKFNLRNVRASTSWLQLHLFESMRHTELRSEQMRWARTGFSLLVYQPMHELIQSELQRKASCHLRLKPERHVVKGLGTNLLPWCLELNM